MIHGSWGSVRRRAGTAAAADAAASSERFRRGRGLLFVGDVHGRHCYDHGRSGGRHGFLAGECLLATEVAFLAGVLADMPLIEVLAV